MEKTVQIVFEFEVPEEEAAKIIARVDYWGFDRAAKYLASLPAERLAHNRGIRMNVHSKEIADANADA